LRRRALHKRPSQRPERRHSTQLDNHCCARRALLPFGRRTARSRETRAVTASISRTHSQCQREGRTPQVRTGKAHAKIWSSYLEICGRRPARRQSRRSRALWRAPPRWPTLQPVRISFANSSPQLRWWSQPGSNRRPQACKASALPTELWPRRQTRMVRMFPLAMGGANQSPRQPGVAMVGRVGVEPTTSRLSGVRSNHLSYRPPCGHPSKYYFDGTHPCPSKPQGPRAA
jgi:hypothetical protein